MTSLPATGPTVDGSATIPAEALFWAVLPAEPGGRSTDEADRYRLEQLLPRPVESLHVIRHPLGDGGHLLVAADPTRIQQHLTGLDPQARPWSLVPASLPDHLADLEPHREQLNLLIGPFESHHRRQLRRYLQAVRWGGLVLVTLLAWWAMERQRAAWQVHATAASAELDQRILQALPVAGVDAQAGDQAPPRERLDQALRQAEASVGLAQGFAAERWLQDLLRSVPREQRYQVDALAVASDRIVLRFRAIDLAAAERLHAAWAGVVTTHPGAAIEPLVAQQAENEATATITIRPQPEPSP